MSFAGEKSFFFCRKAAGGTARKLYILTSTFLFYILSYFFCDRAKHRPNKIPSTH
ncbi:unnamed protein product [Meloidogyne enterolobii]|uniref:Uncharacterized protein n=1 Tax=Meloidogyne enterolobii TaxID=390850 RepID=A0ACB1ADN4_MELEN